MNSIVTQRFIKCHDKLREEKRVRSSRQFALSLDYLPQSLSEIMKGRRDVTIELLRKAVEEYQINPVYIFTGEGPMFMTEEGNKSLRVLTIVTNADDGDERIVHVPIPAQAGYAEDSGRAGFIQNLPTFTLPDYKYKVGTHRSFDVAGDSMEPTLFEGDKVVCSFLEPTLWETSIKDNYVYVIVTRGDILFRRVYNRIKTDRNLKLISDNDYYKPTTIGLGEIKEIWYVRAKISPFLPAPSNLKNYLRDEISSLKQTITHQSQLIENLNEVTQRLLHQELPHAEFPVAPSPKRQSMTLKGKIKYHNIEMGYWSLVDQSGTSYRVVNMPNNLQKDGLEVTVRAQEVAGESMFMSGRAIKILEVL